MKTAQEMRYSMPKGHKEFLGFLEAQAGVRDFIIAQASDAPSMKGAYNSSIEEIDLFRKKHLEYTSSYIEKQNQSWERNPTAVGTGGTPFMKYLLKHQQTILKHLL